MQKPIKISSWVWSLPLTNGFLCSPYSYLQLQSCSTSKALFFNVSSFIHKKLGENIKGAKTLYTVLSVIKSTATAGKLLTDVASTCDCGCQLNPSWLKLQVPSTPRQVFQLLQQVKPPFQLKLGGSGWKHKTAHTNRNCNRHNKTNSRVRQMYKSVIISCCTK